MFTVGVTGVNATDNPGAGVAVARSLRESGAQVSILALSYDVHDPGCYMSFVVDESHRLPPPGRGWGPMARRLAEIRDEHGLDALIPSMDAELPLFICNQAALAALGIRSFLPTHGQLTARAKDHLPELCRCIHVGYPRTRILSSVCQLDRAVAEGFGWPALVKGRDYLAFVVQDLGEARRRYVEIANEWGEPILLQEIVHGDQINLIGVGDGRGGHCGVLSMKKLSTTNLGKVWTGVTIVHAELTALAERFLKLTQWRGPFELECIERRDLREGNDLFLLEINPRFPSWVYLATGCGMNLPARVLELMLFGVCPTDVGYPPGRLLVRYTYELVTDLEQFQRLAMED